METASDAGGGAERGIGARAAEAAADLDSCNGNMYCRRYDWRSVHEDTKQIACLC